MNFEEILSLHTEEVIDLGRDLSLEIGDNPSITREFKPKISYDLLSFQKDKDICFTSEAFTKEDFHIYFKKMITISRTSLGDLMDGKPDIDFTIYSGANKKLKDIFFKSINAKKYVETIPSFGRVGLYNSADGNGKAPRIFFVVGHHATLHILACDPNHLIYEAK